MKKILLPTLLIFATACANTTPSKDKPAEPACEAAMQEATREADAPACDPIFGRADDWDNISDDLARNIYAHNEKCKM